MQDLKEAQTGPRLRVLPNPLDHIQEVPELEEMPRQRQQEVEQQWGANPHNEARHDTRSKRKKKNLGKIVKYEEADRISI